MPAGAAEDVRVAFGLAVRSLRRAQGLTQEQLAERAGVHPRYLADCERGVRNVSIVNIDKLARALGLDLARLMTAVEAERAARPN